MKNVLGLFAALLTITGMSPSAQQSRAMTTAAPADITPALVLAPTSHPPISRNLSQLWLAPERSTSYRTVASANLESAVKMIGRGEFTKAFSAVSQPESKQGPLALYALYYAAVTQVELAHPEEARRIFRELRSKEPIGYLAEAAALGEAAADEALDDFAAAVVIYEALLQSKPMHLDDVYMRLGRAAHSARDRNKAADAFGHVYYEFALSDLAGEARTELTKLQLELPPPGSQRYKLELGRAERLFAARQYAPAREAFQSLRDRATEEDKELIALRLAECDFHQKRFHNARESLRPLVESSARRAEAQYFYALTSRDLGDATTFIQLTRRIVSDFPTEPWSEESLNTLATYFIRKDDDEQADLVFRELYDKYPRGVYAERAAWKAGWRAYRQRRYADTVGYFERAAFDFPRSDYRPSWLYWAGRAREQLNDKGTAESRYSLVAADYLNSYYGRLAFNRMNRPAPPKPLPEQVNGVPTDIPLLAEPPPTAPLIRALLDAQMYEDAVNELRYAQKQWGDSPAIQATIAWTNAQQATSEKGMKRFQLLRGSITTMRRAYPQFMAAGGEELPRDILTVIFPVAYWDLIRRHSATNGLDPYLVAALMAQESTFVADIRSSANAYGLMQLVPSTARQVARQLKLQYSSRLLTDPEANIRMGTRYFADKIKEFGSVHTALASYNAGERPVHQWIAERPGVEREEFIEDIPYPETQNYVKRLLGTAEDYRRLYAQQ